MNSYVYILKCADGQYYTGSTVNLEERIRQHESGEGANFTRKRLPVKLVYYEVFDGIEFAFNREKQLQGWGRKKKEALIQSAKYKLHDLSECKNQSHYLNQGKTKGEVFNK